MGLFAEFDAWLTQLLATYVSDTAAVVATALEPAFVLLAVLYVMVWGYLQMTGAITQPFIAGLKRIFTVALLIGIGLRLWLYNAVIVDTFLNAPGELGARVVGISDPVGIIDQILLMGGDAATALLAKGGIVGGFAYTVAGFIVYGIVGVTALYTMFLLTLSRIALAVLLALGPLFIASLFFDSSRRFFEAWTAQLASYALMTVLTMLVVALLMKLLTTAVAQAAAAGATIQIAQAVRLCLVAGLILLVLRQVMPMAAALGRGFAVEGASIVGRCVGWGMQQGTALATTPLRSEPAAVERVAASPRVIARATAGPTEASMPRSL